ncbi:hypothetical protein [Deinococcus indicus]|uniref:hypothetical protein n=1 Tax=Deinococcus indicus TaxID=223556 RepID=UPI0035714AD9
MYVIFPEKKYKNIFFSSLTAILIVFILPISDIFRYSTAAGQINIASSLTESLKFNFTEKGDFNSYQMLLNTQGFIEIEGIQLGKQVSSTIFFMIPRAFWENKPTSTGEIIAQYYSYPINNLDSPLIAEGYIDFGVIGIIIYPVVFIVLLSRSSRFNTWEGSIFFIFLSFYQVFILRGSLLVAVATLASVYLVIKIFSRLNGAKK